MATISGAAVLRNRTFQELAVAARANDAEALRARAYVLHAMDVTYVRWLALPAIKSGGVRALRALGDRIWADPAFCEDMRKYAVSVANHAAAAYLAALECDDGECK